jgi:hypothetical protein
MDLGDGSLFDLPATVRVEADEPAVAEPLSPSDELLMGIRGHRSVIADEEISLVAKIAGWAALHTVGPESGDAASLWERGLDTEIPVAGPGAPLLSDFAVMELSAVLGRSKDSGRSYIGQVVELAYRLPETYRRVLAGEVAVWKALRIAEFTRSLPPEAATFVDHHLAPFAHSVAWAQVDRLIDEALIRFDPDAWETKRREANETRGVDLGLDHLDPTGIAYGTTALDLPDALDLEQAIARRATVLGELGCEETLTVRRAKALGEIARDDLALDLPIADPETGEITRTVPGRKVELVFHLSEDGVVARCGNTKTPVLPEQIKGWVDTPNTKVTLRPVLDLAGCQPADSYEIPDRIRRQVTLGDHHCNYPYCTHPAETCDLDHSIPHNRGGLNRHGFDAAPV